MQVGGGELALASASALGSIAIVGTAAAALDEFRCAASGKKVPRKIGHSFVLIVCYAKESSQFKRRP